MPRRRTALVPTLALGAVLVVALASGCEHVPTDPATGTTPLRVLAAGFAETPWVTLDFDEPTAMEFAPDGRLFVADQLGRLRVIKDGVLLPTPFVTLTVEPTTERGLLGIAFAPGDAAHLFVYYTAAATSRNRVSRFTVSAADPDVADPASERVLLDGMSGTSGFHNGGAIHFGGDGKLYIGVGDDHTPANAQDPTRLEGKLLRLNADGSIPSDNPFVALPGVRPEIWALGLRNPFTFAVQPGTGVIDINDVGENTWEEIDRGRAGANYGWPVCEGVCGLSGFDDPIYVYDHSQGCSITGGTFYQGGLFGGGLTGAYLFADYCAGWLRAKHPDGSIQQLGVASYGSIVDLKAGPDGALYYLSRAAHTVVRVTPTGATNHAPAARAMVTPAIGVPPLTISADASASTDADGDGLTYSWSFGDGASAGGVTASHTYLLPGRYVVTLVVRDPSGTAGSDTALVQVGLPPVATITRPFEGTLYRARDTIKFAATGVDGSGLPLPLTAYSWVVLLHHDTHTHPFLGPLTGIQSGSFVVPDIGETSPNVWYRIYLTLTGPLGLQTVVTRDVRPVLSTFTLATVPSGLGLTLDGQPVTAPVGITGVVRMLRTLGAPSQQVVDGRTYTFVSWSDGGGRTHVINTPPAATTYTATYAETGNGTGDVVVTTSTTGTGLDPDGYLIVGDGSVQQPIASNGTYRFSGVSTGPHSVLLSGVAAGCVVAGSNPRAVTTVAGSVTTVNFMVQCGGPTVTRVAGTGSFGTVTLTADVTSLLAGTARAVDASYPRVGGGAASIVVDQGTDGATMVTGFTRLSSSCVRLAVRARLDLGELVDGTVDICDNTPSGGTDSLAITLPTLGYRSTGRVTSGGFTLGSAP